MNQEFLQKTILFHGMQPAEIDAALTALGARKKNYDRGDYVLSAGDTTTAIGLVLSGSVTIENNDVWGNRTILNNIGTGGFFAESYALLPDTPLLVDVIANEKSTILFLRIALLFDSSLKKTTWADKLCKNVLRIAIQKNLMLSNRSFHTAPKSIRGRVMAYLNTVSLQKGCDEFDIPFDRQALADYLNVERSALSKELSKMQRDGLIAVKKNHFLLLQEA